MELALLCDRKRKVGLDVEGTKEARPGIGKVVELPPELRALESEAMVRVLQVEFGDDGTRATIPRANVELIAE